MIQGEVEYWESQQRAMIEEYDMEKSYDETEAEAMMREKAKGIETARAEAEAKEGPNMIWENKYGGKSPLFLEILKIKPRRGGSSL